MNFETEEKANDIVNYFMHKGARVSKQDYDYVLSAIESEKKERKCCNNCYFYCLDGLQKDCPCHSEKKEEVKITIEPEARKEIIEGMNKDTEAKLSRYKFALEIIANRSVIIHDTVESYQEIQTLKETARNALK